MRLTNNIKIIILTVIAIVVLALTYYLGYEKKKQVSLNLTHTQSPLPALSASNLPTTPSLTPTITPKVDNSDWKTYTNEKYGFRLKYPEEWSLTNDPFNSFKGINSVISFTNPDTLKEIEKPTEPESRGERASDDIFIHYYPSLKDYADIDVKNLDELINENSSITKIGELTIGGVRAIDIWPDGEGAHYTILIEKDKHLYEIFFSNNWKGREGLTDIEDQILSTFKFIKTETATPSPKTLPTEEWKTYKNEKYGFEFKYPGNLKPKTEFEGSYLFEENLWSIDDISENSGGTPIINIPLYEIHKADSFVMELRIGVNSKPKKVAECLKFDCSGYGKNCLSKKTINGIDFTILSIEGGGMSHYLDGKSYRTVHRNSCFAIEQVNFGTTAGGDLDPVQVQDYRNRGIDTINKIFSTFKLIESTPASKPPN